MPAGRFERGVTYFFKTGLFFVAYGSAILTFAFYSGQHSHSAMTFILVVLGSAITLFGTGTLASGDVDGKDGDNTYKIKIAGGAGVMALIIGFALVHSGDSLKSVFRPERTIVVVTLMAQNADVPAALSDYYVEAHLDNLPVPLVRRDRVVELYIPFTSADMARNSSPKITIQLIHRSQGRLSDLVDPRPKVDESIDLRALEDRSGGFEFRRYTKPISVALTRGQSGAMALPEVRLPDSEIPSVPFQSF